MLKLCVRTHSVQVSQALVQLGVAEDGVTFAHPPQHALEGLHLHPLDEAGHEAADRKKEQIKLQVGIQLGRSSDKLAAAYPSLAPSRCMPVQPVTESVSMVGNSSYWGPSASCWVQKQSRMFD